MAAITRISQLSGKAHTMEIDITNEQLAAWQSSGQMIQRAFPNLSAEEREFLLTGITPEEWSKKIGDEEPT